MSFHIGRGRVIYGPYPTCGLPLLFLLLLVVLHIALIVAIDLGTKQSVYHLHNCETFSLASEARSTSLEHVRAHVSTRLDRGQT